MLIFFAFATIGLTNVITESTIADPIREWWKKHTNELFGDAIDCHQCVGWWSGLLCSVLFFNLSFGFIPIMFGCAFAGSFLSPFEKVSRNYLIEHYMYIMCKSLQETEDER
jgi:hypothetical protein